MSNSSSGSQQEERPQGSKAPRALVHKQIIDVADSRPTATVEALAAEVSGTNINLIEHVLDPILISLNASSINMATRQKMALIPIQRQVVGTDSPNRAQNLFQHP